MQTTIDSWPQWQVTPIETANKRGCRIAEAKHNAEARKQALTSRADVLASLAEYAAIQAAL